MSSEQNEMGSFPMEGLLREGMNRRSFLRKAAGAVGAGAAMGMLGVPDFLGASRAEAANPNPDIAVVAQQMSAQSDQRVWKGMQDWLKTTGFDREWNVNLTDAKGKPGTLVSQIEDAVSRDADAIVVLFGTLHAAKSALETVKRAGTPFFSVDSGWRPPAISDLTTNNYAMGGQFGKHLVNRLLRQGLEEANIAAIIANFHHGTRKRGKVLRQILSENEWINLRDERVIQYSGFFETTQNQVDDWLTRFGDELDAVWCPWDEPAMAASTVIQSRGFADQIFVVGADGHPSAIERMRQPGWPHVATCAQAFELWGAYQGWLLKQIVVDGRDSSEVVPVPTVYFPAPLIVQGVNMPDPDKDPWQATDLYYLYQQRALESMES